MTKLTIILGTFNRLSLLKRCVASMIGKITVSYRIIVLDAGSSDGTLSYLQRLVPKVTVIGQKKRIGQANSFNKILKTLKTDYVCWLSDDNEVVSKVVDQAVSILDDNPTIGMVGLKVHDVTGVYRQEPYIGGVWESGVLNVNQGMIRTALLHKTGYFDSSFPDYGMDADLTTRVLLAGSKVVYTKDVAILHYRDRFVHPGAYTIHDRQNRMRIAYILYRRKYAWLKKFSYSVSYRLKQEIKPFMMRILYIIFVRIGSYFYQNGRMPHIYRDLWVTLSARYVSLFDMWYNRNRSYHLVQKLPGQIVSTYEKQKKSAQNR